MNFKTYTEDVDSWTLKQAQAIVKRIAPHFAKHGYTVQIIGSVAKYGKSHNDLDLLIKKASKKRTELSEVFSIFDKSPFDGWDNDSGTIVAYGNREIDLYYPGIDLYEEEGEDYKGPCPFISANDGHTKKSREAFANFCKDLLSKGYNLRVDPEPSMCTYHIILDRKPNMAGWTLEKSRQKTTWWFKPNLGEVRIRILK